MKFTVMQWNIWHEEDIHHALGFLEDHPADIICLQEIRLGTSGQPEDQATSFLAAQLGMHSHSQDVPVMLDDQNYTVAVAILTKLPILATHFAWINQPQGTGGPDDQFKAYIEARLQLPDGQELTIGTTQMSYSDQFADTPRKQAETQALLKQITPHTTHYVFAGDLNATPPSATVEAISGHLAGVGPDLLEPSWTTKPFTYRGFEAHALGWRLDYIFATQDITVVSSQLLPTVFSNHLPIFATLEV